MVDAGSHDDTAALLAELAPDAHVLTLSNLGFGRSANAGVARLSPGVDVAVVANADTVWRPGSVSALAAGLRAADAAAAAPRVVYPDGRRQANARALPDLATAVGHALLGRWRPDNPWTRRYRALDASEEPGWLSGCALAVDRRSFEGVGGFDPGYFLYVEDVDLGVRLRAAGGRLAVVDDAEVVHEVAASTDRRRAAAVVHHVRSLDRFARVHLLRGPRVVLRPVLWLALAGWAASQLVWERTGRRRTGASTTGE